MVRADQESDMENRKNPSEEGTERGAEEHTKKIHHLPTTQYDSEAIQDFLTGVFHVELQEGEEILNWTTTGVPGYPITEDDLYKRLDRSKKPQAFYFGTSTCRRSPDGHLYNRKALFCRLHLIVLDDIGTKIDKADLPEGLKPTYIIQTSEGNEQWGFVLEEPIDNLDHAQLFVSLVYRSGFTDTGGNMPTKLVRLPCGFNMKKDRQSMPVQLLFNDGPLWTPDALLDILNTGVTWEQITTRPELVIKNTLSTTQGATSWAPCHVSSTTHEGIVDPALEWLYDHKRVYQERDSWVDIQCPWHEEHTEKGPPYDRAGYSPLGWGGEVHRKSRAFHCFHASCNTRNTIDFLEHIASRGGPELPAFDYVPEMLTRYVYDPVNDCAWDVITANPAALSMSAMRNTYARKVRFVDYKGTLKDVSPVGLWMVNPTRVVVEGAEYRPGCRTTLFETEEGTLKFNLFKMNEYPTLPVDRQRVQLFYDYVDYLIPAEDERKFFLDWLACKVQNPEFRGPALFMVAEHQGTGRNTLMDMVGMMFGNRHVQHVPFHRLVGQGSYNTFLESLFVVVDETLAVEDYSTSRKAADILKELIDPRPQHALVNPKYGKQRDVWSVSSYVFLSNHTDGLQLADGDRRYYAIRNAWKPASPDYFLDVNQWMNNHGWEEHLWNDLLNRDVDVNQMVAPPRISQTMREVIAAGQTPLECVVEGFVTAWPTDLIPRNLVIDLINTLDAHNDLLPQKNREMIFRRVWKKMLTPADRDSSPMRIGGVGYRFGINGPRRGITSRDRQWEKTHKAIENYRPDTMLGVVVDHLAERGYDL